MILILRKGFIFFFLIIAPRAFVEIVEAVDARLLPESMSRIRFYLTEGGANGQFNNGGKKESFQTVGENSLTASSLPPSSANAYNIETNGYLHIRSYDLTFNYGITNDWSVGMWLPYLHTSYRSSADGNFQWGKHP